ncbi:hypothetical protein FB451DRAFT_1180502 [Mycena latifolia]|nr:hypothetical protein FB451DRAFT_1180502 [Mycena latifolia]
MANSTRCIDVGEEPRQAPSTSQIMRIQATSSLADGTYYFQIFIEPLRGDREQGGGCKFNFKYPSRVFWRDEGGELLWQMQESLMLATPLHFPPCPAHSPTDPRKCTELVGRMKLLYHREALTFVQRNNGVPLLTETLEIYWSYVLYSSPRLW